MNRKQKDRDPGEGVCNMWGLVPAALKQRQARSERSELE